MIDVDGSMGEGGGSVVRLAVAFSLLFQQPVHIYNIRKNRAQPGLGVQHLAGIRALRELSGSLVEGAELRSTELTIYPGRSWAETATASISTAGSIGLLTQQLQIAACGSGTKKITIEINGGATFGKWAPTEPYLRSITFRILAMMGYGIAIEVQRHGFYPKGGAKAIITLNPPEKLSPLRLTERGEVESLTVESLASHHLKGRRVAERMFEGLSEALERALPAARLKPEIRYVDAANPGCGIAVSCSTSKGALLGADAIGERSLPAEKVGAQAAERLLEEIRSRATCDRFASDQLIPFMALAGDSTIVVQELTSHARTNIELVSMFLGKRFQVEKLTRGEGYILQVP